MYATFEAELKKGLIIPREPVKLPDSGRALIVILAEPRIREKWGKIRCLLGWLKPEIDPAAWERTIRDEWESARELSRCQTAMACYGGKE